MQPDNILLIETYFIAKLIDAKLYGEPKEGLAEAVAARVSNINGDGLIAAANIIISCRKSGTFPKVPECVQAIRDAQRPMLRPAIEATSSVNTNYFDAVKEHAGHAPLMIINADRDALEWEAWQEYYRIRKIRFSHFAMKTRQSSNWTVPTRWPDQFDRSFKISSAA